MPDTIARSWSRIGPSLGIFCILLATIFLFAVPMCLLGKQWEDERRFLKNYRAPNDYETQIAFTMDYVKNSSEYNDVIFLGDSTALINIRPKQFEESTGLKAYNLGTVGVVGFDGFVWVFRGYLQNHPRPKMLILCVHPRALKEPALGFGPWEVRDQFVWCYGPETEETRPKNGPPLRKHFRQGLWIAYGQVTGGVERYAGEPVYNRGGKSYNNLAEEMVQERGYWEQPGALEPGWLPRPLLSEPFAMHPGNRESLFELARLAQENDIRLVIRIAPLADGDGPADSRCLAAWSRELEASFANLTVSRPEVLHYPVDCFSDIDHCNRRGAEMFTQFLADEVMAIMKR